MWRYSAEISAAPTAQVLGRALLTRYVDDARSLGYRRVWLTTTDNVRALVLFQRFGMDPCAFYRNGCESARRLKPTIPLRDEHGVPIAHELEVELLLD